MQTRTLSLKTILAGGALAIITFLGGTWANHARAQASLLDATFNPGRGFGSDGTPTSLVVLSSGKIMAAGLFDSCDNVPRRGVVRLNANGSVDQTFTVGSGLQDPNVQGGSGFAT